MSKHNDLHGPWSVSVAQKCRLDSFWKKRFDALSNARPNPSRKDWLFGLAMLAMIVFLPTFQLEPSKAIAEERPVTAPPYQRTTAADATKTKPSVARPAPRTLERPLQHTSRELIPNVLTLSMHVGKKHKLGMPDDCKVTVGAPEIFTAETDEHGDVTIHPKKFGEGILKFEFDNRASFDMKIVVDVDPAPLQAKLKENGFNDVRVTSLHSSIVLTGHVQTIKDMKRCIALAEKVYPKVVNIMSVGVDRQVQLHCKVIEMESDEAKVTAALKKICNGNDGDQRIFTNRDPADPSTRSVVLDGAAFDSIIDTLRESLDVTILAEPTLTTVSGRPAGIRAGSEIPILVPNGTNEVSVEYKQLGPRVDFVPVVLADGRLRLEVRPQITQIEPSNPPLVVGDAAIPRLNKRSLDMAAEMKPGQTMLVALVDRRPSGKHRCFMTLVRPELASLSPTAFSVPMFR